MRLEAQTPNRVAYYNTSTTTNSANDLFTNGSVLGIGTSTPIGQLNVVGDAWNIDGITVTRDFGLPIACTATCPVPMNAFQIKTVRTNFGTPNNFYSYATPFAINAAGKHFYRPNFGSSTNLIQANFEGIADGLRYQASTNNGSTLIDVLHLTSSGNVGIGTTNPLAKLGVLGNVIINGDLTITDASGTQFKVYSDGHVRAREFRVDLVAIPDYVFQADYKLMSLQELGKYISSNKHLPNIPSASDYEQRGEINLGELNMKLLEKVEELTLYVLDLQKQIDALASQKTSITNER